MQKIKEISHSMISSIAISTIFIASFMLSGSQFSQQALAIHEGTPTATTQNQLTGGNATTTGVPAQTQASIAGNTTAAGTPTTGATPDTTTQTQAVPGGNATQTGAASAQTPTPTAAVQEPPVNQNFVRQATVASGQDPLPGHESHELAFVLPPRSDGAVYSGVLTYTASKPVEVVVLHNYDPQNTTAVPEEYGTELTSPLPGGGGNIAITLFQPPYEAGINSASVPFTGNGLALHTLEDDPFTATYTVNAFATQSESANAPLEFTSVEGEVEEPAAEEPAAEDEAAEEEPEEEEPEEEEPEEP
ncbi:MAG TPA: hypothetical protein VFN98_00415 [Nitrososphaeraceae archaeon]|nr:hypothetical protein [Nitrososphaeraceae archaeon]